MSKPKKRTRWDYYNSFPIQPVEQASKNKLNFLQGCVVTRISRYNMEGGRGLEDLEKAKREIELIIELEGWDQKKKKKRR